MNTLGRRVDINLMPWRERLRERHTRRFQRVLVMAVCLGGLVAGGELLYAKHVEGVISARLEFIEARTQALEKNIEAVKSLEERREVMKQQMLLINELQHRRPLTPMIFDQLTATLATGVYFERISRTGDRLVLQGMAENNRQVSDQLRAMSRSPVFEQPRLEEVQAGTAGQSARRFTMDVTAHDMAVVASSKQGAMEGKP
ncbi:PilN domain-containing protein [Larsenimonas rhizosphaerae]|uniref:PilN domain-containing protein n=1 Tax=Larsenimonas rhizosphaerae TaxID=2944682 RepID=A0AA41ZGK0_9GAMM|nr:PilN domain-containing protein [Larsenimonas rhizosphaerae]MCM2129708.1 PilN domain-containing protein [Larsenimonas rhizosphaerae]MCX2524367.1 PilN domain-containing protein [Larsenimonas rhizosphaerae]